MPEDQLSIAIGKNGQNVRLASKLTALDIDIVSADATPAVVESEPEVAKPKAVPKLKKKEQLESSLIEAIEEHGTEKD